MMSIQTESAAASPAVSNREQLIMEHMPQVRLIARRIHERLPETVSLDDLVSTGIIGLISAIDRYDPAQGVKLKTYAEYKIRGAILDSLRGMDWAPRRQRRRSKEIERAITAAEQRLKRTPSEIEIAGELGISLDEYHEWLVESRGLNVGSIDAVSQDGEGRDLSRYLVDRNEASPAQIVEREQLQEMLARSLERMPQAERTVLSLYYHEELTLREIAKVMDLHESRISQLKTQGLARLRACLDRKWNPKGQESKTVENRARV